jgi:[histone H3]-trimethyl-L-lysine4 demethylase
LKLARGKVKDDDKYHCPVCDWRVKIPRDAARPKLEDLIEWRNEIPSLPFQPEEEDVLNDIITTASDFREHVKQYCDPFEPTTDDITTQRFYLRKVEGADILLAYETNFFRQDLHRLCPIAPYAPPMMHESNSTRKPRPTKQQKLMAQYGVLHPEDLPQELRTKQHTFKHHRKSTDSTGRIPQPLQPAPLGKSETNSTPGPGGSGSNYRPPTTISTSHTDLTYASMFSNSPQAESAAEMGNVSPSIIWQNRPSTAKQSNPPGSPESPIFRPATPPVSGTQLDPGLFSPTNGSFAAAALADGANTQSMASPRLTHSRGNSGGGDINELFVNFTNDNNDEPSRNEAGEALEGLGVVGNSTQDEEQAQRLQEEFLAT